MHRPLRRLCILGTVLVALPLRGPAPAQVVNPSYRERYRPQFHFSPPIHFMNDPNGLVFSDGEYHLFYQYNPEGNQWGHMSWGHAVSDDLVHWRNLPLALREQDGIMIFSGSAVMDRENTSGFGADGRPPIVAIYTGHGDGKQTQNLAFSLDRGRTWTRYGDNPVLDIGSAHFRDPKVFWHEPSRRWVMAVVLAQEKKVRFYGSPNLRDWDHLSDFGPAGSTVGAWECPDLFPLGVRGEAGVSRWVLKVDVAPQDVADVAGGQYFVGDFDGRAFRNDNPPDRVLWIDRGKDFYAAQSWANLPDRDPRQIWIGWMNNWKYANALPTHPWRGAMSIPRSLILERGTDGLQLAQEPIETLRRLRGRHHRFDAREIAEAEADFSDQLAGESLEIVAEFEPGTATEFGLKVRKGASEETLVGYDAAGKRLFVDRTRSGDVSIHPEFRGRHAGPLAPSSGRVRLHLFVDTSSVEVFGNRGRIVITDLIFPDPASRGLTLYAKGGAARLVGLDVWELAPAWRPTPD